MQASRKKIEFALKEVEQAKRTTIILEKEEREFIDQLIQQGKEPGIKPLISKMLNIYRNMMICDWRFPGEYYFGISRIALVNVELLALLVKQIPQEKLIEVGRVMGQGLKVSIETTLDFQAVTADNWDVVFNRLQVQGFGEFVAKDKYLLVKMPFVSEPLLMAGLLEGLLDVKLDLKTTVPPFVFHIKPSSAK